VRLPIPRKARVISKFARVLELDEDGDERHQHAQDSHRQVSSSQEGVLPAEEAGRGQHEALAAVEGVRVVDVGDAHIDDLSSVQVMFDAAIELPEAGHRRSSHPHHEVLVSAERERGIQACTTHGDPASSRLIVNVVWKVLGIHLVGEFHLDVAFPSDSRLHHRDA
jgi:hypothetical protein